MLILPPTLLFGSKLPHFPCPESMLVSFSWVSRLVEQTVYVYFKKSQIFVSFCCLLIFFLGSIRYIFLKPDLRSSADFVIAVTSVIWNWEGKELLIVYFSYLKKSLSIFFFPFFLFRSPASPSNLETWEALAEHWIKSQEILTFHDSLCMSLGNLLLLQRKAAIHSTWLKN